VEYTVPKYSPPITLNFAKANPGKTEMALVKSWLLTRVVQECPVLGDAKIRRWGKLPIIPFFGHLT